MHHLYKALRRAWFAAKVVWQHVVNSTLALFLGVRDAAVHMFDLLLGIALIVFIREVVAVRPPIQVAATQILAGIVVWYLAYRLWHVVQPRNIHKHYACLRELYKKLPFRAETTSLRITYHVQSRLRKGKVFQLTPYFPKTSKGGRGRYFEKKIEHFADCIERPGGYVVNRLKDPEGHRKFLERQGMPAQKVALTRRGVTVNLTSAVISEEEELLGIIYMDATEKDPILRALDDEESVRKLDEAFDEAIFTLRSLDDPNWRLGRGTYHGE